MDTIKPIISLTHNDLDGVGCQLLLRWQYGDVYFRTVSYSNIYETLIELRDLLSWDRNKKAVFLSDLSLKEKEINLLKIICNENPHIKIYNVDHHLRTQDIKKLYSTFPKNYIDLYDTTKSSTSILYYYLGINNKNYKTLSDTINSYDMWKTEHKLFEDGLILNEMYESIGHQSFLENVTFYGNYSETFENKKRKVKNKIQSFIDTINDKDTVFYDDLLFVAYLDRYKSILQYVLNKKISIIISSNYNFSIRLSNDLTDSQLKEYTNIFFEFFNENYFESYYAHTQVFGFNSTAEKVLTDIDKIISFLTTKIN